MIPKTILFIVGPTAAGKSGIGYFLAKKIKGEIISCDSMQVYKHMDIMTSRPDERFMRDVLHHLVGTIEPSVEYNVSRYRTQALRLVTDIIKRKKIPVFVGGSGLYMSVMVDGIFKSGNADERIRRRLYKQAERLGSRYLHEKLQKVDPEAAQKIHPNDTRRLVRALEVYKITGKPISQLQKERKGLAVKYNVMIFCINMERELLRKRIEKRASLMFKKGLVKEVQELLKKKISKTASSAIGTKEVQGFLGGNYDIKEAEALIIKNTWQYARRQLTWFRKDKRIKWVEIRPGENADKVSRRIVKLIGN